MIRDDAVQRFMKGVRYPFRSIGTLVVFAILALLIHAVTVYAVYPTYASQVIGSGWQFVDDTYLMLMSHSLQITGVTGIVLILLNAFLGAIALVNTGATFMVDSNGLKGVLSITPGIVVSGCASCGVGLVSIAGLSGYLALLPFNGNLLRLAGVLLIAWVIVSIGDPRTCSISSFDADA